MILRVPSLVFSELPECLISCALWWHRASFQMRAGPCMLVIQVQDLAPLTEKNLDRQQSLGKNYL